MYICIYIYAINLYMIHKHDNSVCSIFNWFLYITKTCYSRETAYILNK